jgi:hypothetical protein
MVFNLQHRSPKPKNMEQILILLPLAFVLFLFLFPPIFKKGKNSFLFLGKNDQGEFFLLAVTDFLSVYMGKFGASEKHRYRLKKVDLQTKKTVYDKKLFTIWAKFLEGFINVYGPSDDFLYISSYGNSLKIIDLKDGTIKANSNDCLKENPGIRGISLKKLKISPHSGHLQLYTLEGRKVELDPISLKLTPPKNQKTKQKLFYENIFELPYFGDEFYRDFFHPLELNHHLTIQWSKEKNSQRKKLQVQKSVFATKWNPEPFQHTHNSTSFLNPEILNKHGKVQYLQNTMHFLIKGQTHLEDDSLKNQILYLVNTRSEIQWEKNFSELIHPKMHSIKNFHLFVSFQQKFIVIFYAKQGENMLSVVFLDLHTGSVIQEPHFIDNPW